jgi:hypothetical protein
VTNVPARPWLGAAAAFAGAPLVYAIVRIVQHRLSPEPDPGAVIWAEQSATLTRFTVTAFVSSMLLFAMLGVARRMPSALPRTTIGLAFASTAAIVVQTCFRP